LKNGEKIWKENPMCVLEDFKRNLQIRDYSELTIKGYIGDSLYFIKWFENYHGQSFSIEAVQPTDLQEYRQQLLNKGLKPNTINRKLAAVLAFGKWCVETGLIEHNPGIHIRSVDSTSLAPKWLDKKERAAFIRAAEKDLMTARTRYPRLWIMRLRDTTMVITLLNTGIRVREICSLKLSDLEISPRKGLITIKGKGLKERNIPLNNSARKKLREWLNYRPEVDTDTLFVSQRGTPIKPRSVQRAVSRISDNTSLEERITPHTLRHTFAKSLIDQGVSLEKVATLLGHSNLNTTRIYITPSERDLADAVEKIP